MKKTYVKPVITFIELPKNNFIATSGEIRYDSFSSDGDGPDYGGEWDGGFD